VVYYAYDAADRLLEENWKQGASSVYAFAWDYDAVGNRVYERRDLGAGAAETYFQYDAANALSHAHALPGHTHAYYAYDKRGNCVQVQAPAGTQYFQYDDRDLVTAIRYRDGTAQYFHHDPRMRMYAMEDGGDTTYYTWDENGLNLLTERDASGAVTAEYTHGYSPVDGAGTTVAARKQVGGCTYYQYPGGNGHHDTVTISNDAGTVTHRYTCNAWGEIIDEQVTQPAAPNSLIWQANWLHLKEGIYKSPARLYLADAGRFLQRDPLEHPLERILDYTAFPRTHARFTRTMSRRAETYAQTGLPPRPAIMYDERRVYQLALNLLRGRPLEASGWARRLSQVICHWNSYAYCYSDPVGYSDPYGLAPRADIPITLDGQQTTLGAALLKAIQEYKRGKAICNRLIELARRKLISCDQRVRSCLQRNRNRFARQLKAINKALQEAGHAPANFNTDAADQITFEVTNHDEAQKIIGAVAASGLVGLGEIAVLGQPGPATPEPSIWHAVGEALHRILHAVLEKLGHDVGKGALPFEGEEDE